MFRQHVVGPHNACAGCVCPRVYWTAVVHFPESQAGDWFLPWVPFFSRTLYLCGHLLCQGRGESRAAESRSAGWRMELPPTGLPDNHIFRVSIRSQPAEPLHEIWRWKLWSLALVSQGAFGQLAHSQLGFAKQFQKIQGRKNLDAGLLFDIILFWWKLLPFIAVSYLLCYNVTFWRSCITEKH